MSVSFAKSWALVTGASSGIGEEFARQLAAQGAHLILTARTRDKLESLARELSHQLGIQTRVVVADLAEPGGAQRLCRDVDALTLPVEHVINNAGFGGAGPFADADPAALERMVRLNCEALTLISRHFLPAMLGRGKGGIVHVASVAGYPPMPFMATYAATKAFVLSFSTALSEEVRGSGVHVTALCPGPVPTGFQRAAGVSLDKNTRLAELSAKETVERGIRGYTAGRVVCITGKLNNAQAAVAKLLPRTLVTRAVAGAMRRMGRTR